MIQLLFAVLTVEASIVVLLLVKTPIRKLVTLGLDRLKRGRGPVMVKTLAGALFVVFGSSLYSMQKIGMRSDDFGSLSATEQVLWSRHLLEASLMGYSLFLSLIIDRMHHYMKELRSMKKSKEALAKQNKALEESNAERLSSKDKKISKMKERIAKLESELNGKSKDAELAETNVMNLKVKSQGLHKEYDYLMDDNQSVKDQMRSMDQTLSNSNGKQST